MSQSRFELSKHKTYDEAHEAKIAELVKNPGAILQIRRGDGFRLVQRFKSNEARVIQESKRRRGKKRKGEDFSWLTGKP